MRLIVPYTWDSKLLDSLSAVKQDIAEFYASLPSSFTGSWRHPSSLPKISLKEVKEHIQKIHDLGAKFAYVANATCLGNREYTDRKELIRYFDWINSTEADVVVLAIPFLIEFVHNRYPELTIKTSVASKVDSVSGVRYYEELGAKIVTLGRRVTRDFSVLKKIRDCTTAELELVINDTCLWECPLEFYCSNVISHASQTSENHVRRTQQYPIIGCTERKIRNPEEFIKSPWVRPEDLAEYERIGIDRFKISGRTSPSSWIEKVTKIYASRKYDGNIFDFLEIGLYASHSLYYGDIYKKRPVSTFVNFLPITPPKRFLDNRNLDGFIDFFKEGRCTGVCHECGYCDKVAEKYLKIEEKESYLKFLEKMKRKIIT
jgi:collagenase-like PrtC family protease